MARRMPSSEGNPFAHPLLSLTLIVAWIAATIAILSALCASCRPKASTGKAPPPPSPPSNESVGKTETSAPVAASIQEQEDSPPLEEEEKITELESAIHGPIYPTVVPSSMSKRRLSISLSIGVPEGLAKIKTRGKEKLTEKLTGKVAGQDSLWKKTIILGEKCRVPNEEEGDEEEGNQQRNYHPKTPRSLPVSRNNSFANPTGVPSRSTAAVGGADSKQEEAGGG